MIQNIRRQLALLNVHIRMIKDEEPEEVKIAIVDFFEALIDLWVSASLHFRKKGEHSLQF
jgi:hypothetical protein